MTPSNMHLHHDKGLTRTRGFPVAGERLRLLRQARHWTQRIAAERAGVSDRLIRRAENGGPLEQNSLELLAQLYSTPERPLTIDDLIAPPPQTPSHEAAARRHERLLRRWFDEVWNQGRLAAIDELAAPDCVLYAEGVAFRGPAEIRRRAEGIRAGFSGFRVEFEQVATHRDLVMGLWRMSMKHTGVWMGLPPTKKRLVVHGSTWMRILDDRVSERWDCWALPQVTDAVRAAQPTTAVRRQLGRRAKR